MNPLASRNRFVEYCLWAACATSLVGGALALIAPLGGANRIAGVAIPFVVAAIALAANALTQKRGGMLSAVLYLVALLAVVYGLAVVISVPIRLTIEGQCRPAPAPCPIGFDRPITSGESFGIDAAAGGGGLSLLFGTVAGAMQYRRGMVRAPRKSAASKPPENPSAPGS